jgi:integrase
LPGTVAKNRKSLALPLTGSLLELLNARWAARTSSGYVVERIDRRRFDRTWRAAAAAVGHPELILHDLRHSGARTLIRAGVPEDVVLKAGNWRTGSMLTRYNVVSTPTTCSTRRRS